MGGALGLRAARCEPFGRGLSRAAREQPATVGVGPARTVGGVLWGPRGTRTANGRGVRPPGSGTRLEPSSADRPHLGWLYVVVAVWLPMPRFHEPTGIRRFCQTKLSFEQSTRVAVSGLRWMLGLVILLESAHFGLGPAAAREAANVGLPHWIPLPSAET